MKRAAAVAVAELTVAEVAAVLGVTDHRVRELVRAGELVAGSKGSVKAAASWMAWRLARESTNTEKAKAEAELRLKTAQADQAELDLAKARSEVAPVAAVAQAWSRAMSVFRARVLPMSKRLAPVIVTRQGVLEIEKLLRDELGAVLLDLSRTEVMGDGA